MFRVESPGDLLKIVNSEQNEERPIVLLFLHIEMNISTPSRLLRSAVLGNDLEGRYEHVLFIQCNPLVNRDVWETADTVHGSSIFPSPILDVPHILFFWNGLCVYDKVGFESEADFIATLERHFPLQVFRKKRKMERLLEKANRAEQEDSDFEARCPWELQADYESFRRGNARRFLVYGGNRFRKESQKKLSITEPSPGDAEEEDVNGSRTVGSLGKKKEEKDRQPKFRPATSGIFLPAEARRFGL